jgi:cephalosporin-C deacetylase
MKQRSLVCRQRHGRRLAIMLAALGSAGVPAAQAQSDATQPLLSATPDHADGIYHVGEKIGWTLTLPAGAGTAGYHYVVKKNGLDAVDSGALTFPGPGGSTRIEVAASEPEMVYVEVAPPAPAVAPAAGEMPKTLALGAAVDPQKLRPSAPRPADFPAFWRRKLRALAAVPANPVLTPSPSGQSCVDYATIVMNTVGGAHIHGQIARPTAGARLPGLVIFQWAGGPYPLQKQWVTERAAQGWLALNIEPHDVLPDQPQSYYDALPAELKSYQKIGLRDRDKSYFLRMYLSDYRAIEYLAGRPDWDGRTLVVMGTSMGGQQSLCAAALNHRVTALIVNVPAGADSNGALHGRVTGYPNWPSNDPAAMRTALYFDTVSCAPDIRAPSLVAMGFVDTVAPPVGIWTAFNQIRAPKLAVPLVDSPHNNFATREQLRPYVERSEQWLAALRTGGTPPTGPGSPAP